MTTIDEAREKVYDQFVALWGTRTIVALEGEVFSEPADSRKEWVRLSVRANTGGGGETIGPIGGRKYRRRGSVFVQIFTPVDRGMLRGDQHAKAARAIFEGMSFSGLDFDDSFIRELPSDGKWARHNFEALFAYEETR